MCRAVLNKLSTPRCICVCGAARRALSKTSTHSSHEGGWLCVCVSPVDDAHHHGDHHHSKMKMDTNHISDDTPHTHSSAQTIRNKNIIILNYAHKNCTPRPKITPQNPDNPRKEETLLADLQSHLDSDQCNELLPSSTAHRPKYTSQARNDITLTPFPKNTDRISRGISK